jgi:hypothetical protein
MQIGITSRLSEVNSFIGNNNPYGFEFFRALKENRKRRRIKKIQHKTSKQNFIWRRENVNSLGANVVEELLQ